MTERPNAPMLPRGQFLRRFAAHAVFPLAILLVFLGLGVLGYHALAGLGWLDALLNASMILTGMGPVDSLRTPAAKWFASGYALLSGVVFLSMAGVFMAPLVQRLLHRFHLDLDEDGRR
jgi:hypothetical protein